ncbi:hypothetical protein AcV5_003189 [Taiwanofungus camphoratus]|nr:hypothetical protein AcV5_003189 [Antrodia cinnamomea]
MKDDIGRSWANTISIVQNNFINTYCQAAISTLVLYDYIISFGQEVQFIWGGRTSAVVVFYVNRCTMLALSIVNTLMNCPWNTIILQGRKFVLFCGGDDVLCSTSSYFGPSCARCYWSKLASRCDYFSTWPSACRHQYVQCFQNIVSSDSSLV